MKGHTRNLKLIVNTIGVLFLMLGLIPVPVLSQVGQVYAQEEVTPEPPPAEEPPAEAPAEAPAEPVVDITADPTFELPPTQVPEEVPVEPTAEPVADIVATPVFELPPTESAELPDPVVETVVEVEVAEVVEALAEVNFVITNEAGETVPLASTEAVEILTAPDPVGCPLGVTPTWLGGTGVGCTANYTSIQDAIDDAMVTDGWTVYVQPGDYAEHVNIAKPNITIYGNPGDLLIAGADPLAPVLLGTGKLGTGFNITAEGVTLIGFVIKGFNIGILADAASGSTTINILNNTIIENAIGIMNKGGTGKPGLEVHYNNFKDNDVALDNNSVETNKNNVQYVQAQNNYWGCALGPIVYEGPGEFTIWSTKAHTHTPDPNCEILKGVPSLWDHQKNTPDYSPFKINLGPTAPLCGNGVKEGTEQCDGTDGVGAHQTCSASCTLINVPWCGDGIINGSEVCDGSALPSGLPAGVTCSGSCTLNPYCGDGIINGSEVCDGSALPTGTPAGVTCSGSCTLNPYCGDGIINGSEVCDGSALPSGLPAGVTCSGSCTLNPYCGDGIINGSEVCDGSALPTGLPAGVTCTGSCTLNPYCGDGVIQTNEECDPNANPTGAGAGQFCNASCEAQDYCGDGIINNGEACDPNANPTGAGAGQFCNASCQVVTYCGDGVINNGEACDPNANPTGAGAGQYCNASCQVVTYCGDGVINNGEACDPDADPTGAGTGQYCSRTCEVIDYCGDGTINNGEACDPNANPTGAGTGQFCTETCTVEDYCGDGTINNGEACDYNADPTGAGTGQFCTETCTVEDYCGDGTINNGEACDYNADPTGAGVGQFCTETCTVEDFCGDGKINNDEECDYNAEPTGAGEGQYCSETCEVIDYCGDGILDVQQGEECDDGNNTSGDGCSATCQDEPPPPPPPPPPAPIPLLLIPVTGGPDLITAGIGHTCALTTRNGLECWGLNDSGQVGDATFIARDEPVDVVNINPFSVIALTSGIKHTCALTSDNKVYCWGLNSSGQLGDGTTENRNQPVLVEGLTGTIVAISAGAEFTCAQNAANEVFCWGNNATGQLNDGTEENRTTPVKATAISEVLLVSGGFMELQGITPDGAVQLWNSEPIVPVTGLPNTGNAYVSADRFVTGGCSVTTAGAVDCWGEIVDGKVTGAIIPDMLATGAAHACTMKADGLACWGSNSNGQIGDGTLVNAAEATLVKDLDLGVIALAAGAKHTCVILSDESVYCWGQNIYGQLGDGSTKDSSLPVETK